MNIKSCVYLISVWSLASVLAISAERTWADDMVLNLEEPTSGSIYSGVANIRGWVVGSRGIGRVELYVDGQYEGNIPVGGKRPDVGNSYPSYPNSENSGFSMAFNYSEKTAGMHNIRVRAFDQDGDSREETAFFQVVRFENPYVNNGVSLSNADVIEENNRTLIIRGMVVDGKSYDARLDWRTEIQGYTFSEIAQANNGDGIIWPYFSSPSGAVAGDQINVELQAQNNGRQSATFTVFFFLSKDSRTVSPDEYLDAYCTFSLVPGASDTCAILIGIPEIAAGDYFLIGYVADDFPAVVNPITIHPRG